MAVRPAADGLPSAAGPYGSVVAAGLSHRTATVALRERAALTEPSEEGTLGGTLAEAFRAEAIVAAEVARCLERAGPGRLARAA
jgi:hypothetical protein